MNILKTSEQDFNDVVTLLKEVNLPKEGISDHFHNFFIAKNDDQLVGVAGLEIYENMGLIRSVAVHPSYQGKGLGKQLVDKVHSHAKANEIEEIYLLTDTADKFFSKLDYKAIPREKADPLVQQSTEFEWEECKKAVVMVKKI
ncbi:MAG: arsenic resistance N-acetyltransferase ArsN2 [Candidatus Hodarchaeales archaeon]